ENVPAFCDRFEQVVASSIADELLVPEIVIDAEVELKDLTNTFYKIVAQMEPFGPDNCKPVFMVRNVMDTGYSRIVKDLHLKLSIVRDNIIFSGIGFNLADKYQLLQLKQPVDVVFTLD